MGEWGEEVYGSANSLGTRVFKTMNVQGKKNNTESLFPFVTFYLILLDS